MFDVTQNSVFSHYTNSLGPVLQMIYWEVKFLSIAYLQLIKFYWNKVMLIHFVYGCYCATVGETSGPQNQQYFLSCPLQKKSGQPLPLGIWSYLWKDSVFLGLYGCHLYSEVPSALST